MIDKLKSVPRATMEAGTSSSVGTDKKIKDLERALKVEERMRRDATASAIAREEELLEENAKLQSEIEELQKQLQMCRPPLSLARDPDSDDEG